MWCPVSVCLTNRVDGHLSVCVSSGAVFFFAAEGEVTPCFDDCFVRSLW